MTLIKLPSRNSGDKGAASISGTTLSSDSATPDASTAELSGARQTPSVEIHPLPKQGSLLVKVHPPKAPSTLDHNSNDKSGKHQKAFLERAPCDIVLVIDVSASMASEAPAPDDANQTKEDYGLSILDLTKHAARTILETLDERDRLGIVAYSADARVVQPLEKMTKGYKHEAAENIDGLEPQASTNMWHGITTAINMFDDKEAHSGRVPAIMVLTDGMPNTMCPAQGYVPKIRDIQDRWGGDLPAAIHTFGFGYSLRSGLLKSIAEVGGGNYAFIPDAGMIGTVFVHAVANLQTTYAHKAVLRLTYPQGFVEEENVFNRVDQQEAEKSPDYENARQLSIPLGGLQYGQSRDILLRVIGKCADSAKVTAVLNYACMTKDEHAQSASVTFGDPSTAATTAKLSDAEMAYYQSRSQICAYLASLFPTQDNGEHVPLDDLDDTARHNLQALVNEVTARCHKIKKSNGGKPDPMNQSLLDDLAGPEPKGQISMAIKNDEYWNRWGRHYLPSLLDAHMKQICNSFKDPGPLQYGKDSPLFIQCRNNLDAAFDGIPPPKPSRRNRSGHYYSGKVDMSRFHSSSNPCFAGSSSVVLASQDGPRTVRMSKLRRGMDVLTPRGPRKVVAVLATPVNREVMCRVALGSENNGSGNKVAKGSYGQPHLIVTPWHPLSVGGREASTWAFPAQVAKSAVRYTGYIYSVLLQPDADPAAHAILVGAGGGSGVCWGVTLGHGVISQGSSDVRAHTFFGNYAAVVASLKNLGVRKNGLVLGGGAKRDGRTGLVCGFNKKSGSKSLEVGSRVNCRKVGMGSARKVQFSDRRV